MKIFQIVVGFIAGALFLGSYQQHGFWQASGITLVYIILIGLFYTWWNGNFDKEEYENPTYPKGVLGYSGNENKINENK